MSLNFITKSTIYSIGSDNVLVPIQRQAITWTSVALVYWRIHGQNVADSIFKSNFLNEKHCILIDILLKHVPMSSISYKSALVQVMAWHRTGDKPWPEMMIETPHAMC